MSSWFIRIYTVLYRFETVFKPRTIDLSNLFKFEPSFLIWAIFLKICGSVDYSLWTIHCTQFAVFTIRQSLWTIYLLISYFDKTQKLRLLTIVTIQLSIKIQWEKCTEMTEEADCSLALVIIYALSSNSHLTHDPISI